VEVAFVSVVWTWSVVCIFGLILAFVCGGNAPWLPGWNRHHSTSTKVHVSIGNQHDLFIDL
jgi:hypothetical protein